MNLLQRFKRYLIGVAIGIILTGVFFKDRLSIFTSWLPGNVVLSTIKRNDIRWSDKAKCQQDIYKLDKNDIKTLLDEGDVIFKESQVRVKPYEYSIKTDDERFKYRIKLDSTFSTILNITGESDLTDCD